MPEEAGTVTVQSIVDEGKVSLDPIEPTPRSRTVEIGGKKIEITPVKVRNWSGFTSALSSLAKLFEAKRGEMFKEEEKFSASLFLDALSDCGGDIISILSGMTGIAKEDLEDADLAGMIGLIDAWLEVNDAERVAERFFALSGRIRGTRKALQELSKKVATSAS